VTSTRLSSGGTRSRRKLRDRASRIQANRIMRRIELQMTAAIHRYQVATVKSSLSTPRDWASVAGSIDQRTPGLAMLIKSWLKRVVFLFGRQIIDSILKRAGRKSIELKDSYDIFEESALEWLDSYALDQATTVNGNVKKKVKKILQEAFDEGLGEDEAAQLVVDEVGGAIDEAARIARTEVHTAANVGSDEAATATGLELVKEWAATDDDRTRESHAEADGQRVAMDEQFEVGDALLDFPGDPKGPAKEVINCRCVVLYHPVIDGEVIDGD
jgi:hypothetical protein